MTDINTYANNLLIEFLDASHDAISSVLRSEFGDSWFSDGIERHLDSRSLDRTRKMLASPMAVVDMDKTDEELYGVEHIANIINGNWSLFGDTFGNRNRTRVYFEQIAELRHNISHRRQHHMLSTRELFRFVDNAGLLLTAFGSPTAAKFESIATSLEQGSLPWGRQLSSKLPLATEIVSDFVGREAELHSLRIWLTTHDARQLMIWGYGGSGKSALAYEFARGVRDGALPPLQAVVWLSAKVREYIEGTTRERPADFHDLDSFRSAFWNALYGEEPPRAEATPQHIIDELNETPLLFIIDDLDSVLKNHDLARFLLYEIRVSRSMILYTSRQRMPGIETIEVLGFGDDELSSFVRSRARGYRLETEECLGRLKAIRSVTNGFPLFVDDLLRHAKFAGLNNAIGDWTQRSGDAAREYSLRRQLSSLGEAGRLVLIAVAVAIRPVSIYELSTICGFTDEDVQHAIQDLLDWRLLNHFERNTDGHPTFSCNMNTRRLVQKTYGRDPVYLTYKESFQNRIGGVKPAALRRAVGIAISEAGAYVSRGDFEGAIERIRSAMTGDLADNSDLWGVLGRVLSRNGNSDTLDEARNAFRRSHNSGSRKEDTYHHWKELEREQAEKLVNSADDAEVLKQWRKAAQVAELGIERCGDTARLCNGLAYLRSREAKTLERLNNFTSAKYRYRQAAAWARRALAAPNPSSNDVNPSRLYRSLVIALDGSDDHEGTVEAMVEWKALVGSEDPDWRRERERLTNLPEYRRALPL